MDQPIRIENIDQRLEKENAQILGAYEAKPSLIEEHYYIEQDIISGGYGNRQIHELIQNGADAIEEKESRGKVHILLDRDALYCANEGAPFSEAGLSALLGAHRSTKSGTQIGRFGLGFKSVLAVTKAPRIYSTTGCFGFSYKESSNLFKQNGFHHPDVPVLRLGFRLDRKKDFKKDPYLDEFGKWATTIVKLPLQDESYEQTLVELENFDPEFLLFGRHVCTLILEDRKSGLFREITAEPVGKLYRISDAKDEIFYRLFETLIEVTEFSEEVLKDTDPRLRNREMLPLIWAVPTDSSKRRKSRFWAFFRTETETTLRGILNAPWKTNTDRLNLLEGVFNKYLIRRAARLVAENIHQLLDADDPGSLLDVLPARDDKGWADRYLRDQLLELLKDTCCVPDNNSILRVPEPIRLRSQSILRKEVKEWATEHREFEPDNFAHISVENQDRRSRAKLLGCQELGYHEQSCNEKWLSAVVNPRIAQHSIAGIKLADIFHSEYWVKNARFILTTDSNLVKPDSNNVFLDGNSESVYNIVHADILEDEAAVSILKDQFDIKSLNPEGEFISQLNSQRISWGKFWDLLHQIDQSVAINHIQNKIRNRYPTFKLKVKVLSGNFKQINHTLLPGTIVNQDNYSENKEITIDEEFHSDDHDLLSLFGAVEEPFMQCKIDKSDPWYKEYIEEARKEFAGHINPNGSQPRMGYIEFDNSETWGPLEPFTSLSDSAKAIFTRTLLKTADLDEQWLLRHSSTPDYYPKVRFLNPICWIIKKYGTIETSLGVKPVHDSVGPQLQRWRTFLPVAECTAEQARLLDLPVNTSELLENHWSDALDICLLADMKDVATFYAFAAGKIQSPEEIYCTFNEEKILFETKKMYVVFDSVANHAAMFKNLPFIRVDSEEEAQILNNKWNLRKLQGIIPGYIPSNEASPLVDRFPGIQQHISEKHHLIKLQSCTQIWIDAPSDENDNPVRYDIKTGLLRNDIFFFPLEWSKRTLLNEILKELKVQVDEFQKDQILNYLQRSERQSLVDRVKNEHDIKTKLLTAVGFEVILEKIGQFASEMGLSIPDNETAAKLAFALFGIEILQVFSEELDLAGLNPPSSWAGSQRAREFVDELGFPLEYAGFSRKEQREPWIDIDSPVKLKPLHDFQSKIVSKILKFMQSEKPGRGLLSLPTGAGKTRVAIESLLKWIELRDIPTTLLWIAGSDELCEQAVKAWDQAWRGVGPEKPLRINRLWGSTNTSCYNRGIEVSHVIVATYQTLKNRTESHGFEWIFHPNCIIVDEAHGAISPSYTGIFRKMGMTHTDTNRFLIGLTATPFRGGEDSDETERLVGRFDAQRFDHGIFPEDDVYQYLQKKEVLANVDWDEVEGIQIIMTDEELEHVNQYYELPPSVINRLGQNKDRNEALTDKIVSLDSEWSVIFFATSVNHAKQIAVQLCMRGIESRAITGETPASVRTHYISEFKRGRIRVLTNYGVLTTGFDAPAVRAIVIGRPVYSKLLYQQMIGRGLRGPLNGGKESCTIINVSDNVENYGEKFAFRHYEYLWDRTSKPR